MNGSSDKDFRGETRRQALRSFIEAQEPPLSLTEIARRTGIAANAIGNFLCGRTSSLNIETAEPLARLFGVSLDELYGNGPEYQVVRGTRVFLKGSIAAGRWVTHFTEPRESWVEYAVPHESKYAGKSYLLSLATNEMNQVWEAGTRLEVVDLTHFAWRKLRAGNRVIILRFGPLGKTEVSCRQIELDRVDGSAVCRLISRTSDAKHALPPITVPWPIRPNRHIPMPDGTHVEVRAVVIASMRPEIDDDQ